MTAFKNAIPKDAPAGVWELNLQPEGVARKTAEGYEVIVPVHETDDHATRIRMERWVFAADSAKAKLLRTDKLTDKELGSPEGGSATWERVVGRRAVVASGPGRKIEAGQSFELALEGVVLTFEEGDFRPLVAPTPGGFEIRGLIFAGKGRVRYVPADKFQKQYLWHFQEAKSRCPMTSWTPSTAHSLIFKCQPAPGSRSATFRASWSGPNDHRSAQRGQ